MSRKLNYQIESYQTDHWARGFSDLSKRSLCFRYQRIDLYQASSDQNNEKDQMIKLFQNLLQKPPEQDYKKTYTF